MTLAFSTTIVCKLAVFWTMVIRLNYKSLSSFANGRTVVDDAMSRQPPTSLDLEEALEIAEMQDQHQKLTAISLDGVILWDRFDITDFAPLMPSIAVVDKDVAASGTVDFRYGYVGESINEIAQRPLKGVLMGDVLVGDAKDMILQEYSDTLSQARPRASFGRVTVSEYDWVHYMRFLYPVNRDGNIDRVLLIMLYAL